MSKPEKLVDINKTNFKIRMNRLFFIPLRIVRKKFGFKGNLVIETVKIRNDLGEIIQRTFSIDLNVSDELQVGTSFELEGRFWEVVEIVSRKYSPLRNVFQE